MTHFFELQVNELKSRLSAEQQRNQELQDRVTGNRSAKTEVCHCKYH